MTTMDVKRRHHHVWQQYLQPWTFNSAIWCLQGGRIFSSGTRVLAVETDFYRIGELTLEQLSLIKMLLIDNSDHIVQDIHLELVRMLSTAFEMIRSTRDCLSRYPDRLAYFEADMSRMKSNLFEEMHTAIENSFRVSLDQVLEGDISFYDRADTAIPFCRYIAAQLLRTKGTKERVIDRVNKINGIDLAPIWTVVNYMFAINIGASFYIERDRRSLTLLENKTDIPFITGDQPVLNLLGGDGNQPPEHCVLYYPVSPTLALILGEVNEPPPYTNESFNSDQASDLNSRIYKACHRQVFAGSEASLRILL